MSVEFLDTELSLSTLSLCKRVESLEMPPFLSFELSPDHELDDRLQIELVENRWELPTHGRVVWITQAQGGPATFPDAPGLLRTEAIARASTRLLAEVLADSENQGMTSERPYAFRVSIRGELIHVSMSLAAGVSPENVTPPGDIARA